MGAFYIFSKIYLCPLPWTKCTSHQPFGVINDLTNSLCKYHNTVSWMMHDNLMITNQITMFSYDFFVSHLVQCNMRNISSCYKKQATTIRGRSFFDIALIIDMYCKSMLHLINKGKKHYSNTFIHVIIL